jgi:hypothetical protein
MLLLYLSNCKTNKLTTQQVGSDEISSIGDYMHSPWTGQFKYDICSRLINLFIFRESAQENATLLFWTEFSTVDYCRCDKFLHRNCSCCCLGARYWHLAIYLRVFTFQIKESLEETEAVSANDLNAILGQNKSIIRKKQPRLKGWNAMGIELPIAKQNLYGRTILARGPMK